MGLRDIQWKGVNWMHMAQDRDQCQDLVNMEMHLWVPCKADNLTELLFISQEILCSMELVSYFSSIFITTYLALYNI
jgi:hypothetical protein